MNGGYDPYDGSPSNRRHRQPAAFLPQRADCPPPQNDDRGPFNGLLPDPSGIAWAGAAVERQWVAPRPKEIGHEGCRIPWGATRGLVPAMRRGPRVHENRWTHCWRKTKSRRPPVWTTGEGGVEAAGSVRRSHLFCHYLNPQFLLIVGEKAGERTG